MRSFSGAGQRLPEVGIQRIEEDILNRKTVGVITVLPSSSSGMIDINPVGSLVAGAPESVTLNKGLCKMKGMGIFILPVGNNTAHNKARDMACRMWNFDPWQNEKAAIIGHQINVALPERFTPADEVIPGSSLPGCGTKKQTGNIQSVAVFDKILHVFSNTMESEVMMPAQIPGKTGFFIGTGFGNYYSQRFKFRQCKRDKLGIGSRHRHICGWATGRPSHFRSDRRQGYKTAPLKFKEKAPGGKGLGSPRISMPIPETANGAPFVGASIHLLMIRS